MKPRIGIMANVAKKKALKLSDQIISWLNDKGIPFAVDEETGNNLEQGQKLKQVCSLSELKKSDIIVILGGDGFLLNCARQLYPCTAHLLPVNLGKLGFNAQVSADETFDALTRALNGALTVQKRILLEGTVTRHLHQVFKSVALNDITLAKTLRSRIIHIEMYVDGNFATTYTADGVIISTPTGSTAYNMAMGGPIVHPEVNAILATPLCPHSLSQRVLVIPSTHEIRLHYRRKKDREEAEAIFDGQESFELKPDDTVEIRKAAKTLNILTLSTGSYLKSLRDKLHWGGHID